ncbi:methyltransferase domain-containing protein [Lindgomyces ingoldianus]|uniref:Methyltransferase domain-containing protein n=1 Tax=Lindgomyces ingoldianus TaxID=673940 RepID=A0ACB6RBT9_9PLEO|nr:methyltransferase domain-containing protein [Lindgomyces ingoldianus]KAF2475792.1 methyltransferase domain-containing protein [Lindgomyces ingoldianus]
MTRSSEKTYSHQSYAAFRPIYLDSLYNAILSYHKRKIESGAAQSLCVDLGSGHGVVARAMSKHFVKVIGIDPSEGMIALAKSLTKEEGLSNVTFWQGTSEQLYFVGNGTVDLVLAGQAAHWFDYSRLWPELQRKVKPGGSLGFWGLKNTVFVDYPKAVEILKDYIYSDDKDKLGSYWPASGVPMITSMYRNIEPPEQDWEDIERVDYIPGTSGCNSGEGTLFVGKRARIGDCKETARTWSGFYHWHEAHPEARKRSAGGSGDVIDACFDEIANVEPEWKNDDFEVEVEWESFLLLARRRLAEGNGD